ncbi:sodium-dependent transporter [Succinimonas sp.]|uniref:sodium-dependent transporter n=1 Tax=Succinimonas sp. TaxID=1936151 RepID=UPI00386B7484
MTLRRFLSSWSLPLAILAGILAYVTVYELYRELPEQMLSILPSRKTVLNLVAVAQPFFLFVMLFISFAKIRFTELRPALWALPLLLLQGGIFAGLGWLLYLFPDLECRFLAEAAMLAFICPTATAAAVIVRKLAGSVEHIMAYTIMANLLSAVLIPAVVPFAHPLPGFSFGAAFGVIMIKVMPLLMGPVLAVGLCRLVCPGFLNWITRIPDLAFYFWLVSLPLAMAVSVRYLMHSPLGTGAILEIAAVSLAACLLQFALGRFFGRICGSSGDAVTAGQALGQKSTVFMIWTGYTFFTPVTAITGGFYSIWHNSINSWQLYRKSQEEAGSGSAASSQDKPRKNG